MTSAAIYNQYWDTAGGGETFCGGIAQALAEDGYEVTLLTAEPFDAARLGERLSVDLGGCTQRVVDGPATVAEASADYDLFVNGSYLSNAANRAEAGLYVVHFPGKRPHEPWYARLVERVPDRHRTPPVTFEWGEGFHMPDPGAGGSAWTSAEATLQVTLDDTQTPGTLQLIFGHLRPVAAGPAHVEVSVDGETVATVTVPTASGGLGGRVRNRAGTTVDVPVTSPGPKRLDIRTNAFVPADLGVGHDTRALGVPFRGVSNGSRAVRFVGAVLPGLQGRLATHGTPGAISTYDVVASNSRFTAHFVEDWWSVEHSPVLYPPVVLRSPSLEKRKSIVAVGRFFDADSGHSKKQIELVRAFRRLLALGVDDWTLTFVGGCDEKSRPYLDRVRAEAEGIPVEFHIDASGADRDAAIAAASVFWHATGMGEDAEQHPDRMEHFGISTVEAMSAGAVPVVYAGGGQLEIVEPGVSGFHFRHIDELVATTRRLIADPDELRRMSAGAIARASDFGMDAFRQRLREVVALAQTGDQR